MTTRFRNDGHANTLVLLQPDCTGGEGPLLDQDGKPVNFKDDLRNLPGHRHAPELKRIRAVSMKLTAYCKRKQLGRRAHLYP